MSDRTFTLVEIADFLQMNKEVVRKHLSTGKLPGRKVGREWRCLESELIEYLKEPRHVSGTRENES